MDTQTSEQVTTTRMPRMLGATDRGARLSLLWVFAVLNYIYCDVLSLMDPELLRQYLGGNVGGLEVSQGFLLGASVLMEIPMAMVLLSSLLPYRGSRWANIVAGSIMTLVQVGSLFMGGGPTAYYAFFSVIEIATTVFIVVYAWRWRVVEAGTPTGNA